MPAMRAPLPSALALLLALRGLAAAALPAAAPPALQLTREGGVFRLQASFDVAASASTAWEVLTDYEGMTRFVPTLRKSEVLSRSANGAVITQEGQVHLLVFSRRVPLTLKVTERPPTRIDFQAVGKSQFEEYDGAWTIEPSSGACRVSYQLFAEMRSALVPRGVARGILQDNVGRQLELVQAEIERRAAAAPR